MNDEPPTENKPVVGRPFSKSDPRINRSGRPRSFDQFRALAQKIAQEKLRTLDGTTLSVAEAILRSWAKSKNPQLQMRFIEYCYGAPPSKLEVDELTPKTKLILRFAHEDPEQRHKLPGTLEERLTLPPRDGAPE